MSKVGAKDRHSLKPPLLTFKLLDAVRSSVGRALLNAAVAAKGGELFMLSMATVILCTVFSMLSSRSESRASIGDPDNGSGVTGWVLIFGVVVCKFIAGARTVRRNE
jgi:hypothetical protein